MNHGIDDRDWAAFTEGVAEPAVRQRIEAHLAVCAECGAELAELREWSSSLTDETEMLRHAMALPASQMEQLLASTMQRVAAAAPATGSARGRVAALQSLLGPLFGPGTIRMAMEMALGRSAPGGITAGNWAAFASELSDAILATCGMTAARLVGSAALSLALPPEGMGA